MMMIQGLETPVGLVDLRADSLLRPGRDGGAWASAGK